MKMETCKAYQLQGTEKSRIKDVERSTCLGGVGGLHGSICEIFMNEEVLVLVHLATLFHLEGHSGAAVDAILDGKSMLELEQV